MSEFFKVSDGELSQDGKAEMGGGDFEPIPAKTQVLFAPVEAKWGEIKDHGKDFGHEGVKIQWAILKPDEYKNRRVFQNIKVGDPDPKVADKAMRMLVAIDTNAGGKLFAAGTKPSDADLARCLVNKQMMGVLQVWKVGDKAGNWVQSVAPKSVAIPKKEVDF